MRPRRIEIGAEGDVAAGAETDGCPEGASRDRVVANGPCPFTGGSCRGACRSFAQAVLMGASSRAVGARRGALGLGGPARRRGRRRRRPRWRAGETQQQQRAERHMDARGRARPAGRGRRHPRKLIRAARFVNSVNDDADDPREPDHPRRFAVSNVYEIVGMKNGCTIATTSPRSSGSSNASCAASMPKPEVVALSVFTLTPAWVTLDSDGALAAFEPAP